MHPKKIQFEGEIPISINVLDDNKHMLVGTNLKNNYKIEIDNMK